MGKLNFENQANKLSFCRIFEDPSKLCNLKRDISINCKEPTPLNLYLNFISKKQKEIEI